MISKETAIDLLADMYLDSKFASKMLYPERFNRPFDPIHDQIFEVIDRKPGDPKYRPHKLIIAPRGIGKTSICGLAVPSISAILQRYSYIVVIGYNAGDAIEKTEELKYKLTTSELIKSLYGDIKTDQWSKEDYVIKIGDTEIRIHPRGSKQPVRGRLFHDSRPGLIIVDDLEKAEETDSEELRGSKKSWFYGDVLNAIDRGLKHVPGEEAPWEILVVGTILHQDSLLVNLHESDDWDSVLLEICDDNFVSNAPNMLSDAECKALYESMRRNNETDVWFREYRNMPVPSGEDAAFQARFYRYYDEAEENLHLNYDIDNIVIVDPSRTATPGAAPTGIVGVGVDMKNNKIYLRDAISKRMFPEEMYEAIYHMMVSLKARVLAVEVTGLHEFISHPLKTFLRQRGLSFEFVELHARKGVDEKGKKARVRSLVDFYRQGIIWHNVNACQTLEQQLAAFPNARDWSLMDPFGYIVELLEKGDRYLSFPGQADFETKKDVEAEFRELERFYDEVDEYYPLDDFRVV